MEVQFGPIESDSATVWLLNSELNFARSGTIHSFDSVSRAYSDTGIRIPDSTLGIDIKISPDEKYLAFSASKTGGTTIYLYSKETNQSDVLLDDPKVGPIIGWIVIP